MPNRPHCEAPDACRAKGNGHCRGCNFRAVATRLNADPEFAAKNAERSAERMRKLHADPEFAAKHAERSAERMRKLNADRRASYGLLPGEEDAWRTIKAKGFGPAEAARIVIAARKREVA